MQVPAANRDFKPGSKPSRAAGARGDQDWGLPSALILCFRVFCLKRSFFALRKPCLCEMCLAAPGTGRSPVQIVIYLI